jgi:hypothetical protein
MSQNSSRPSDTFLKAFAIARMIHPNTVVKGDERGYTLCVGRRADNDMRLEDAMQRALGVASWKIGVCADCVGPEVKIVNI